MEMQCKATEILKDVKKGILIHFGMLYPIGGRNID
jgi:hypothetical protein